jgi:hypothetical protein
MPTLARSALLAVLLPATVLAQPNPAGIDWQRVGDFSIARSETTVGQFRRFADDTGTVTRAERAGGGEVYEAGWTKKPGWIWRTPYGRPAHDDEPAVHVTYDEAQAFCRWAGGRLPPTRNGSVPPTRNGASRRLRRSCVARRTRIRSARSRTARSASAIAARPRSPAPSTTAPGSGAAMAMRA